MVYPSHYPRGDARASRVPNAEPYKVINNAISTRARARSEARHQEPEHVRPWLQAFTLGKPPYGAAEIEAQKKAVYDAGYDGWVMWNPGSKYEPFLSALSRRQNFRHKKVFEPAAAGAAHGKKGS